MIARHLVVEYPLVAASAPAIDAVRLIASRRLPGLAVVDDAGQPIAVLSGSQVLRAVLPKYVVADPGLARVLDETMADQIFRKLSDRTVGDLLTSSVPRIPKVGPDDTVIEIASRMAHDRVPLVAVMDGTAFLGIVTASRLFRAALPLDEQ